MTWSQFMSLANADVAWNVLSQLPYADQIALFHVNEEARQLVAEFWAHNTAVFAYRYARARGWVV